MKNNYIICGIHTDCGKSVISVLLYEYLRDLTNQEPLLVKPIQTGPFPDTDFYQACHIEKQNIVHFYSMSLEASPHIASRKEHQWIDLLVLKEKANVVLKKNRPTIFELAGGLLSPINDSQTMLDMIKLLQLPVILVSDNYLGAINHTLLTTSLLQSESIPIAGLIFNSSKANKKNDLEDLSQWITDKTGITQIGELPYLEDLTHWLKSRTKKRELSKEWHLNVYK